MGLLIHPLIANIELNLAASVKRMKLRAAAIMPLNKLSYFI